MDSRKSILLSEAYPTGPPRRASRASPQGGGLQDSCPSDKAGDPRSGRRREASRDEHSEPPTSSRRTPEHEREAVTIRTVSFVEPDRLMSLSNAVHDVLGAINKDCRAPSDAADEPRVRHAECPLDGGTAARIVSRYDKPCGHHDPPQYKFDMARAPAPSKARSRRLVGRRRYTQGPHTTRHAVPFDPPGPL